VPTSKKVVNAFPTDELKSLFANFWDSKMQSPLQKPSPLQTAGTVFALQPELSSQQAVGILVACVSLLGYRPSVDVIEKGGYINKTAFVAGLLARVATEFTNKQNVAPAAAVAIGGYQNATASI